MVDRVEGRRDGRLISPATVAASRPTGSSTRTRHNERAGQDAGASASGGPRQAERPATEALGQLVGGVARDFNNLLMAVLGNLALLSKKLREDVRLHRLLNGAMEGARRGATLTQRLPAFARELGTQGAGD